MMKPRCVGRVVEDGVTAIDSSKDFIRVLLYPGHDLIMEIKTFRVQTKDKKKWEGLMSQAPEILIYARESHLLYSLGALLRVFDNSEIEHAIRQIKSGHTEYSDANWKHEILAANAKDLQNGGIEAVPTATVGDIADHTEDTGEDASEPSPEETQD